MILNSSFAEVCFYQKTSISPFMSSISTAKSEEVIGSNYNSSNVHTVVSKNGETITQENFRDLDNKPKSFISRGTIIKLDTKTEEEKLALLKIINGEVKPTKDSMFIPVEVVSTEKTFVKYKPKRIADQYVKENDKGKIYYESIKPMEEDDHLFVKENTFLLNKEGERVTLPQGHSALKPVVVGGQYKIKRCCESTVRGKCHNSYIYSVVDSENNLNGEFELDPSCPHNTDNLQIMSKSDFSNLSQIKKYVTKSSGEPIKLTDFDVNDFGLFKYPLRPDSGKMAFDGSFHHYKGSDPDESDEWGKPTSMCSVMKLAKIFNRECKKKFSKGCIPQFGDMSYVTPGVTAKGKDPLLHASHASGECLDIRPLRKDDNLEGMSNRHNGQYDRKKTQLLIDTALKLGAKSSQLFFNDPGLTGVKPLSGHSDHLHICFPESDKKVQKSCETLDKD